MGSRANCSPTSASVCGRDREHHPPQLRFRAVPEAAGEKRSASYPLPRSASQLRQPSSGKRRSHEADSGMAGSQRLLHHRQHLCPPRLRFQALVCTGDDGGAGLWQCVSVMPYAPKTGWTGDVPAKKNGQTNKIHLSIRFGGASGSRTLAPVSRPIAFRVRPLTTT